MVCARAAAPSRVVELVDQRLVAGRRSLLEADRPERLPGRLEVTGSDQHVEVGARPRRDVAIQVLGEDEALNRHRLHTRGCRRRRRASLSVSARWAFARIVTWRRRMARSRKSGGTASAPNDDTSPTSGTTSCRWARSHSAYRTRNGAALQRSAAPFRGPMGRAVGFAHLHKDRPLVARRIMIRRGRGPPTSTSTAVGDAASMRADQRDDLVQVGEIPQRVPDGPRNGAALRAQRPPRRPVVCGPRSTVLVVPR